MLFPSPFSTLKAFGTLCATPSFWQTVGVSFLRIFAGIALSLLLGIVCGVISGLIPFFDMLFAPVLSVIRATPVASFIVLIVLWISRDSVPIVISVLMVLPVVWTNVKEGVRNTDRNLLEMAQAYRIPLKKRIKDIYIPSVIPYFLSAARASLGMAWKAGIAAEVIVLPLISIGRQLYYSSNNLETATMFAWTMTVILLSVTVDFGVSFLFRKAEGKRRKTTKEKTV